MTALREALTAAIAAQMDGDRKRLAQELVDKHGTALLAALDDAERYRWLREFDPLATKCVFLTYSREELDAERKHDQRTE